jgi:hypothetical protein
VSLPEALYLGNQNIDRRKNLMQALLDIVHGERLPYDLGTLVDANGRCWTPDGRTLDVLRLNGLGHVRRGFLFDLAQSD